MSLLPPGWRLTALLAIGCAVLGGLVAVQWRERPMLDPEGSTGAVPPDRVETSPEPVAPPPPPPPPLRARLEGVALVGDARVAVIRDLNTNEGLRLSEGMQFKGWTVDAVEPDRALLKRNDRQVHELKLEQKK